MALPLDGLLLGGIVLCLGIPVLLNVLGRPSGANRRAAAKKLGLEYVSESQDGPPKTDLRPLLWADAPGRTFRFTHLIRGRLLESDVQLFDLEVRRHAGRSDYQESFQTAALFRSDKTFPLFTLVPWKPTSPHRVDIDLPCLRAHALMAADKAPAADLFLRLGPSFLRGTGGWLIEGGGNWVLVCRYKEISLSDKLKDFLTEAQDIFEELRAVV